MHFEWPNYVCRTLLWTLKAPSIRVFDKKQIAAVNNDDTNWAELPTLSVCACVRVCVLGHVNMYVCVCIRQFIIGEWWALPSSVARSFRVTIFLSPIPFGVKYSWSKELVIFRFWSLMSIHDYINNARDYWFTTSHYGLVFCFHLCSTFPSWRNRGVLPKTRQKIDTFVKITAQQIT